MPDRGEYEVVQKRGVGLGSFTSQWSGTNGYEQYCVNIHCLFVKFRFLIRALFFIFVFLCLYCIKTPIKEIFSLYNEYEVLS
jgi:hypothetical protein